MSEKPYLRSKPMESSVEIRDAMWRAFPPRPEHNRKSWLWEVARSLGWRHRRVKALFYCEARVVTADEWRTINARLDAAKRREREADELRAIRRGVGTRLLVDPREDLPLPMALAPLAPRDGEERET